MGGWIGFQDRGAKGGPGYLPPQEAFPGSLGSEGVMNIKRSRGKSSPPDGSERGAGSLTRSYR